MEWNKSKLVYNLFLFITMKALISQALDFQASNPFEALMVGITLDALGIYVGLTVLNILTHL